MLVQTSQGEKSGDTHASGLADVLVLTAMELEGEAVRERLDAVEERWHPRGTLFEVGRLPGSGLRIALAVTGPGNGAAAVIAERGIEYLRPGLVLFVGIAGALHSDIRLGDVVVATKVHEYHGGKQDGSIFNARPNGWTPAYSLLERARHLSRTPAWQGRVHLRPIAAGEVVLNGLDGPVARQIRRHYNDTAAVEMESAGLGAALRVNDAMRGLVIRGISDHADGAKDAADDGGSQPKAAAAAAVFALALCRGLPVDAAPSESGPVATDVWATESTGPADPRVRRSPPVGSATSALIADGHPRWLFALVPPAADDSAIHAVTSAFGVFGYQAPAQVVRSSDAATVHARLDEWLEARGPDDVLGVYLSGAMEIVGADGTPRLALHTAGSRPGYRRDTVPIGTLFDVLHERPAARRPRHLLLVLEVSGTDTTTVLRELAALPALRPDDPAAPTGIHVVVAAGRRPGPSKGFAEGWLTAVDDPDLAPRGRPYLDVTRLADRLRTALPATTTVEAATAFARGPDLCLPNPRHHLVGVDPTELAQWWEPTARAAVGQADTEPGARPPWLFSGRRQLNQEIVRWLSSHDEPLLILTGAPGSGKSTVLARAVTTTVPDLRRSLSDHPSALRATETAPEDFRFAVTIPASRLSTAQIRDRIEAGLAATPNPRTGPPVILIDALDEAEDPHGLVVEVLRPLAQEARIGGPRLVIATRSQPLGSDPNDTSAPVGDLISPFRAEGALVHDVGSPTWLETGDIAEYCEQLLAVPVNTAGRPNLYAAAPRERAILARSIESRARHSFLLAAYVARRHTLDAEPTDSRDPAWGTQFPERIGDAMRQEIDALYGVKQAARQLALLRPLAFAEGSGLVREPVGSSDLWAVLASRLDPQQRLFTPSEVDALLTHRVATHLVARVDQHGATAYRFHHQALAESFTDEYRQITAAHQTITDVLLDTVSSSGRRDWTPASPYLRRALPAHARLGGHLPTLAEDAGLYAYCDPYRLHEALVSAGDPSLVARSHLLRPYLHRLTALPPPQRAFLISIVATVTGYDVLARQLAELADLPVTIGHVRVRHEALRQSLAEGPLVTALAAATTRDGAPLIFLGNGRYLDVRDPASGALVERLLTGLPDAEAMVTYLDHQGFPVVALASARGVRVWDVTDRSLRARADLDFGRGMVAGRRADASPFLAGWTEEHVTVWTPRPDGESSVLPVRWEPGQQPITAVAVVRDPAGRDFLAVGAGGRVTVWDVDTHHQVDEVDLAGSYNIQLEVLQPGRPDGLLLITTGLQAREAWLWQSTRGARQWPFPQVPVSTAGWSGLPAPTIALGYLDGAVDLWSGDDQEPPQRLHDGGLSVSAILIGPEGATNPAVIAIDTVGRIQVWNLRTPRSPMALSGSSPHAVTGGSLRDGGRYLAVGRNDGADLWRLDEVANGSESRELHENEADRVVVASTSPATIVTAGQDGWMRLWHGRSGSAIGKVAIPSGGVADLVLWTVGDRLRAAVTAAEYLLVYDLGAASALRRELPLKSAGRLAYVPCAGSGGLLAVADRQQVHVIDGETLTAVSLAIPKTAPDGRELSDAARNVVSLGWLQPTPTDRILVVGTQGGVISSWRYPSAFGPDAQPPEELGSVGGDLSVVMLIAPYPGPPETLCLVGTTTGQLRVYDLQERSVWADLTKDDARIGGAATVKGPDTVVTAHIARNASGLRLWDPARSVQVQSVVRSADRSDSYVGPPRPGRGSDGQPFVAYAVEDGLEILAVTRPGGQQPLHLSLPVTVTDVAVREDEVYVCGGGGYVQLKIEHLRRG